MGCITPKSNENKSKILSRAKMDEWRGSYLSYGEMHYVSFALGFISGALTISLFAYLFS